MAEKTLEHFVQHILEMRDFSLNRKRGMHYTEKQKEIAFEILNIVEECGGTIDIAADLLCIHRSTFMNWYEKATRPEGWKNNLKATNIQVCPDTGGKWTITGNIKLSESSLKTLLEDEIEEVNNA